MQGGPSVDNLLPAIAQSFAVILIGYLFGWFKIIHPGDARAISELVGKLALPALLFQNLAVLDLSTICWGFMAGILVAKGTVFLVTVVLTLTLTRLDAGKAGLFGIFTTQSNDFALGLPIVRALYGGTTAGHNFNYVGYIYLLAPISLGIINPIGFLMMEYGKQAQRTKMKCHLIPILLRKTLAGVALNPVIFMTALGIIYNVIVHFGIFHGRRDSADNIPSWLNPFLTILGDAYTACALFLIGIFMVGKLKKLTGVILVTATLLTLAKSVLLPIVADQVISLILPHGGQNASRGAISTFGFLYGTFPTAPSVFVYASQYNLAMEIVAASIILCTLLSAPIIFISGRLVLIQYATEQQYSSIIENTRNDVTVVSVIGVLWVLILFGCARRYRSFLHVIVMHLMAAQILEMIGAYALNFSTDEHEVYWQIFSFYVFFVGVLATRIWAAWLAVGLVLLLFKGPRVAEKAWLPLMFSAWGVPAITTIIMVLCSTVAPLGLHRPTIDVSFFFGEAQLVVTIIILVFCFIVGSLCTIVASMMARKLRQDTLSGDGTAQNPATGNSVAEQNSLSHLNLIHRNTSATEERSAISSGAPQMEAFPSLHSSTQSFWEPSPQFSGVNADVCSRAAPGSNNAAFFPNTVVESPHPSSISEHTPLLTYSARHAVQPIPTRDTTNGRSNSSEVDITRFIILLLFLLTSSLVGILIVIWKLNTSHISGIFIGVNVLDTITNFGQGFFVFIVFGFEKHWFWTKTYNRVRKLWFKIEVVELPLESDLTPAVVILCEQFKTQHMTACKSLIVSDKRYLLKLYESVFIGGDFVEWLIGRGVVTTREAAVQYGLHLLQGRVITHVTEEHYFHDDTYFYKFCI